MSKQCVKCGSSNVKIWDSRTPSSKVNPCREDIICQRRYRCGDCAETYATVELSRDQFEALERAIADAHIGSQNMTGLLDAHAAIGQLVEAERRRLAQQVSA